METQTEVSAPTKRTLEHLLTIATRSHSGTSFSPEKRGESVVTDYSNELDSDIAFIREQAAKNADIQPEQISAAIDRYKTKYEHHLTAYLHSHSNIVSSMIAGPSNFPVRQMQKRNQWADNKYSFFREYRKRALAAISKSFKKNIDPLEAYKNDLANREALAIKYVEVNKAIRKHKGNEAAQIEALKGFGYGATIIHNLLHPDYGKQGIPSFSMTNNNANIKRIKSRIAQLEALAALPVTEKDINGVTITDNTEANRVQITFPGKPSDECRGELKSSGFRWTPSNGAWQAFRNQRNYSRGCEIIRKYYPN